MNIRSRLNTLILAAAAVLLPGGALAQDVQIPYQGFLTLDDLPCNGPQDLVFIFTDGSGTEVHRNEFTQAGSNPAEAQDGAFSVVLTLPEAVTDANAELYLEIGVNGVSMLNRQKIYPALYAKRNAPGGDFHVDANLGVGTTSPQTRLHLDDCADVSLAGGGCLVVGDVAAANLAMDDNEIMARNNGAVSDLHFQANGGDTRIGGDLYFSSNATRMKGLRHTTFKGTNGRETGCPALCTYGVCRKLTSKTSSSCSLMSDHGDIVCEIMDDGTNWWLCGSGTGHDRQCIAGCLEWNW